MIHLHGTGRIWNMYGTGMEPYHPPCKQAEQCKFQHGSKFICYHVNMQGLHLPLRAYLYQHNYIYIFLYKYGTSIRFLLHVLHPRAFNDASTCSPGYNLFIFCLYGYVLEF